MPLTHRPTPEQDAAMAAFASGQHLVLQAGAGSGKTSTLEMLAHRTRRRGRYIAFNKSIVVEARRRFPSLVDCSTGHSMAFRKIGHRYQARLDAPRMSGAKLAALINVRNEERIGERMISPGALCFTAQDTVKRYCYSADQLITRAHVPWTRGIREQHDHDQLVDLVLPLAELMWRDLQNPEQGRIRFQHDHYVKLWALDEPRIYADYLMLDEAQDTNPVLEKVVNAQRRHSQLILVGDSAQAIYGWRGARDVMTGFEGTTLPLSRSFRFGDAIADEANRWLTLAGQDLRITGTPTIPSSLTTLEHLTAILCRTNGGAISEILSLLAAGRRVALNGRVDQLKQLTDAARALKESRRTDQVDLRLFTTWGEVQDYVEHDPDGRDLQPFVDVIDEFGVDTIEQALSQLTHESAAEIVVSTAHKSKGREWSSVRIADDFVEPEDPDLFHCEGSPGPIDPGEARLAYVAVTRAQHRLDLGGLSWIHRHPQNPSAHRGLDAPGAGHSVSATPTDESDLPTKPGRIARPRPCTESRHST